MVTRADGTKISNFLAKSTLADTDLVTIVSGSTNYKMSVADFRAQLGVGAPTARALIYLQNNIAETTITTPGTPVLASGAWQSEVAEGFSTTAGGRVTYTGTTTRAFTVDAHVSIQAASGTKQVAVYIAKNGSVITPTKMSGRAQVTPQGNLSTGWELTLSENDYLEIFIGNDTDTTNLIAARAILRVG
jgi:hypothetical protein